MQYQIQKLNGANHIVIEDGDNIQVIPVEAIATWGTLLGESDSAKVLGTILSHEAEEPAEDGTNEWTPLFDTLNTSLDEMSKAGVQAEFMADLLDPALGAPVPGPEALAAMAEAQAAASITITLPGNPELDGLCAQLDTEFSDEIAEHKAHFLDVLAPVCTLPSSTSEGVA